MMLCCSFVEQINSHSFIGGPMSCLYMDASIIRVQIIFRNITEPSNISFAISRVYPCYEVNRDFEDQYQVISRFSSMLFHNLQDPNKQ